MYREVYWRARCASTRWYKESLAWLGFAGYHFRPCVDHLWRDILSRRSRRKITAFNKHVRESIVRLSADGSDYYGALDPIERHARLQAVVRLQIWMIEQLALQDSDCLEMSFIIDKFLASIINDDASLRATKFRKILLHLILKELRVDAEGCGVVSSETICIFENDYPYFFAEDHDTLDILGICCRLQVDVIFGSREWDAW